MALPSEVADFVSVLSSDVGEIVGFAWVLFVLVALGLVLFGLVRRVVQKTVGHGSVGFMDHPVWRGVDLTGEAGGRAIYRVMRLREGDGGSGAYVWTERDAMKQEEGAQLLREDRERRGLEW